MVKPMPTAPTPTAAPSTSGTPTSTPAAAKAKAQTGATPGTMTTKTPASTTPLAKDPGTTAPVAKEPRTMTSQPSSSNAPMAKEPGTLTSQPSSSTTPVAKEPKTTAPPPPPDDDKGTASGQGSPSGGTAEATACGAGYNAPATPAEPPLETYEDTVPRDLATPESFFDELVPDLVLHAGQALAQHGLPPDEDEEDGSGDTDEDQDDDEPDDAGAASSAGDDTQEAATTTEPCRTRPPTLFPRRAMCNESKNASLAAKLAWNASEHGTPGLSRATCWKGRVQLCGCCPLPNGINPQPVPAKYADHTPEGWCNLGCETAKAERSGVCVCVLAAVSGR